MNKWIKFTLSIVISGVGLYYAFGKIDLPEIGEYLLKVNLWYLALSVALIIFSIAVRAERWQMLLEPIQVIPFRPLFGSTMIGYFGNGVMPFRLGEILRAYSISARTNIDATTAFGTVILERILDMLGLVVMIVLFGLFYPFEKFGGSILVVIVVLILSAFGFILILGRTHSRLINKLETWKIFQRPIFHALLTLLKKLIEGLTSIRQTKHVGQLIIHTIFLWVIYYAMVYFTVLSTNISLDWIGVGILLVMTSLAISIPAAPGFVGTYHAVAVYVLTSLFGVELTESQAFAVIIHAVGYIPLVLIGAIYFLRSGMHLRDMSGKHIVE